VIDFILIQKEANSSEHKVLNFFHVGANKVVPTDYTASFVDVRECNLHAKPRPARDRLLRHNR